MTKVGQFDSIDKHYCTRCGELKPCFVEWDYYPAGSNLIRYAFCGGCLDWMRKTLKEGD